MSTAQELVTAAIREGNLRAIGETPTDAELTEGLARLNNFITGLFGMMLGEHLRDWNVPGTLRTAPVAANYPQHYTEVDPTVVDLSADVWPYPPSNSRLVCGITAATTVYMPENPHDGARIQVADAGLTAALTLDGNGRQIEGAATVEVEAADLPRTWFYRADLGNWTLLSTLALDDDSPLPDEFDDLLITGLCIRLSPRYGLDPRKGTVNTYTDMMRNCKTRYRQPTVTVFKSTDIPNSQQSYGAGGWMR